MVDLLMVFGACYLCGIAGLLMWTAESERRPILIPVHRRYGRRR